MSIVRFGQDGSEVYVYLSMDGWVCHDVDKASSQRYEDAYELMNHLEEVKHRLVVPDWVFDIIPLGPIHVAEGDSGPAATAHMTLQKEITNE